MTRDPSEYGKRATETRTDHACPLLDVIGLQWALHAAVTPNEHVALVSLIQGGGATVPFHRDL